MGAKSGRVVLTANSSWNIVNFRSGLIRELRNAGYEPVVVAPKDASAEDRMAALGVERHVIPMQRSGLNPLADLRLLGEYRRLFRDLRPVAVLGFTIKPNIYGAIAARSVGVPFIANVSGLGTAFIRGGLLLALVTGLYRVALRSVAITFFQNPDDRALFVSRKIVSEERARVLPGSGVDLEQFKPQPAPAGPLRFLLIGRLLSDKGVREFVEAARALREELPGARFQLLGPIDHGNRTAIASDDLGRWINEGVIDYLGSTDDVRPYIAEAGAVVLPSYREGLPRSLLEAAAMGRPMIATDVPGCREIVEDGKNGMLCQARNSASLARAMKAFANMAPSGRARMGDEARRTVEERFSEAVVIRSYLEAVESFRVAES